MMKSAFVWIALLLGAAPLRAQETKQEPKKDPAAAAQPDPARNEDFEAQVVALKGTVDVKRPEDKDWVPAERNMKLKKGSEICTAVASTATLLISGNIRVDVKALTQAKIEVLAKSGQGVNADVKLKFGTLEVDIQKGDLRSDLKVTAPNSTTSVSGSHGIIRAPAMRGNGLYVCLRTESGMWIYVDQEGVGIDIEGRGRVTQTGLLPSDIGYIFASGRFLNYYGRNPTELYQDVFSLKAGDPNPWDVPLYEFGGSGPSGARFLRQAAFPFPPPPPPGP